MTKNTALWIAQGVLAAMFLLAGGSKLVMPAAQMTSPGPVQLPVLFIRFIGVCETLGAIGMILPGVTGITPGLTPLGAAGLVVIMIGATVVSSDGFIVASVLPNEVDEDLIGGMSASLLGVGERISADLMHSQMEQTYVRSPKGYIVVNAAGPDAVLVLLVTRERDPGPPAERYASVDALGTVRARVHPDFERVVYVYLLSGKLEAGP